MPAVIVLPTGTGKTEVMLASMVMHRPRRLLVLVPSAALRQPADKFSKLGVLYRAGIVTLAHKTPIVGTLLKRAAALENLGAFTQANVFVSTVAMIQTLPDAALDTFLALFDVIFFDEAHHIPAHSWKRVCARLKSTRVVGFTATPFRLDERPPNPTRTRHHWAFA